MLVFLHTIQSGKGTSDASHASYTNLQEAKYTDVQCLEWDGVIFGLG
jgi:hypothetical protein